MDERVEHRRRILDASQSAWCELVLLVGHPTERDFGAAIPNGNTPLLVYVRSAEDVPPRGANSLGHNQDDAGATSQDK